MKQLQLHFKILTKFEHNLKFHFSLHLLTWFLIRNNKLSLQTDCVQYNLRHWEIQNLLLKLRPVSLQSEYNSF